MNEPEGTFNAHIRTQNANSANVVYCAKKIIYAVEKEVKWLNLRSTKYDIVYFIMCVCVWAVANSHDQTKWK